MILKNAQFQASIKRFSIQNSLTLDHTLLTIFLVDISIRIDKFDIEENAVIISVDGKNKIHI